MYATKSLVFAPVLALTLASTAVAQQLGGPAPVSQPRGYVSASAGMEFEPPTKPVFSVEYGDDLHRNAQAYVTFSYFENLMKRSFQDELTATATTLTSLTGMPLEFVGRDRGLVFTAGAKYLISASESVRPYIGGGAGVLNIRRTIREPRLGDVTQAVLGDFGLGNAQFTGVSTTKPLVEAALGVGVVAGQTYIDVGYRYRRAFLMDEPIDFSQFSAGIGYRF